MSSLEQQILESLFKDSMQSTEVLARQLGVTTQEMVHELRSMKREKLVKPLQGRRDFITLGAAGEQLRDERPTKTRARKVRQQPSSSRAERKRVAEAAFAEDMERVRTSFAALTASTVGEETPPWDTVPIEYVVEHMLGHDEDQYRRVAAMMYALERDGYIQRSIHDGIVLWSHASDCVVEAVSEE
jgi:DNA-binding MarR family transcriptional regulator